MTKYAFALLGSASIVAAFPWVAEMPGVDSSLYKSNIQPRQSYKPGTCPNNPDHKPAVPINAKYPYGGAIGGLPGTQKGGYQVPAPGDKAHYYTEPGPLDIRGPCPGVNAAANHNFLAHDGITTYSELVDMVQNVYNGGYDLAVFLASISTGLDGDPITQKLSIGCDATSRTSSSLGAGGQEPGLNGHNRFEADASLTRDDYFTSGGNNYAFNGTLFEMFRETTGGIFDLNGIAKYRKQRYDQSRAENPNFYFGPKGLFQYGAASFVYEFMAPYGSAGVPTLENTASFFGAKKEGDKWVHVGERIPANWHNRVEPYGLLDVIGQIFLMYAQYPVELGGNVGLGNFNGIGTLTDLLKNGTLPNTSDEKAGACLLYQFLTANVPSSISQPENVLNFFITTLDPIFANYGCPIKLNN